MKRLKYGLLAAAMVASVAVVPAVASAEETATTTAATEEAAKVTKKAKVGGKWVKTNDNRWWYSYDDGTYASYEFVSGWWVNKAGYWGDADGDHSTYDWYTLGGTWHYGNRAWSCGSEYAADNADGNKDGKAKWWKIDGQWYYFMADGSLVTSAVVGNYIVDNTGAWLEGYKGQWRHGATNKTAWWYAISDETGKLVDWFDWTDGIVQINGDMYIFDSDGWLFTDQIVPYPVTEDSYIFLAPDKDGRFGLYTSFEIDAYDDVDYSVDFEFKNHSEALAAAKELQNFLVATVAGDKATDPYKVGTHYWFDDEEEELYHWSAVFIDDEWHDVIVGKLVNFEEKAGEEAHFDPENEWVPATGTTYKWSQTATNAYVSLTWDQVYGEGGLADLVESGKYKGGTWGFDGSDEDIQELMSAKESATACWDGIVYIPVYNYVKFFAKGTKATVEGSMSGVANIIDAYRYGAAAFNSKLTISVNDSATIELNSVDVDDQNIALTINGKTYEGLFAFTTETVETTIKGKKQTLEFVDDLFFIFAGDQSKTLIPIVDDMELIDGFWLMDSATQTAVVAPAEEEEAKGGLYFHYKDGDARTEYEVPEDNGSDIF